MSNLINLILNQYVISLIFLIVAGFLIRTALVVTGQKWANTYHHLATCLLLPGIGYIITSIIKDDIALSLGMIGALSIIRFRNPVKSPFELVIFFALLTLGVATTTGLKLAFLLLILVLTVVLGIKFADQTLKKFGYSLFQFSFGDGNSPHILEITSSKALENLQDEKKMIYFHFEKQTNQYVYRLIFKSKEELMEFKKSLENNSSILDIRADMQG
ncbi:hypothetical protein N8827_01995 [Pelagibacteraceae bacterium]|nr:hypothetical protein [Pelagibacteraceae bacterium]